MVTVRFPHRGWAECARDDMLSEGLCVRLSDTTDCNGQWELEITGCAEKIRSIRRSLEPPPPPFDWATSVNGWLGEPR